VVFALHDVLRMVFRESVIATTVSIRQKLWSLRLVQFMGKIIDEIQQLFS